MMTKIKICGITCVEDALAACEAGADALGFVLVPEAKKRNRYIKAAEAMKIIAQLPSFVLSVAVVVNEPLEVLRDYARIFDRIQLHGDESPELCRALGSCAYKAFQVKTGLELSGIECYPGSTCLLDAWTPDSRGGSGHTCDWDFAAQVAAEKNVILAGGLTPENVEEAVRRVRPYGVDASSSLESEPGKKDYEQLQRFINNTRKALLA
ncbi:MAG: phosphoribosylanthranilate isomerase [Candidatus Hydrogenedentes bacterium]|nr:phosphoribosylanthranilate isomerase [Candidatus Hydrogenedentota bacterium]